VTRLWDPKLPWGQQVWVRILAQRKCAAESSRRARLRLGQKIISALLLPLLLPCE
jgi:hypothetical protein